MQTMHPSIMLGPCGWQQDRMPIDEFRHRLDELHHIMDRERWNGLLVYGDAREHAALAYVSNFIPRMRWGMALLSRDGRNRLLCSMSTRDLPAMRGMTWIDDVQSGWEWERVFDPWLTAFDDARAELVLGTVGFALMPQALRASVDRSIGACGRLQGAADIAFAAGTVKRPREVTMIRASCAVLDSAVGALRDTWRSSGLAETAALAGERKARQMAAQDVRTLVSFDGGRTLVPFAGRFEKFSGPLVGYLAVKLAGYWSDMLITEGAELEASRRADVALDQMLAAAKPGTKMSDLHAAAVRAIAPLPFHPNLDGSVGHGIGLSLHEGPEFGADEAAVLEPGGVYTLQAGVTDPQAGYALKSAMFRLGRDGVELLSRSPPNSRT